MFRKTYLFIFAALLFSACGGDVLDILLPGITGFPTEPEKTEVNITSQNWPFSNWGDNKVKPGDDFFRYCIGKWYDKADAGDGTTLESLKQINQYYNQAYFLNVPMQSLQTLVADAKRIGQDNGTAYTLKALEMVKQASTYKEVGKVMGLLTNMGYNMPIRVTATNQEGVMGLGVASEQYVDGADPDNLRRDFRRSPFLDTKYTKQMCPTPPTRASYSQNFMDMLNAMLNEFDGLSTDTELFTFYGDQWLAQLGNLSVQQLKDMMSEDIIGFDAIFLSSEYLEQAGYEDYEDIITMLYQNYLNYDAAHYLYESGFYNAARQARLYNLCDEMRNTLSSRIISSLEWMSSSTKRNALEKLNKMKFFVAYPDQWFERGLPKLKGNSFVEDVHLLIAADFNITKHVCSMPISQAVTFICPQMQNIATDNAFYAPAYNVFFIFPNYMFEPYYREDVLDAYLYAHECLTIGHEMLHGFDSTGSQYDANGAYAVSEEKPYGWWTEQDDAEYKRRLRLLVNSYNQLPYEPWLLSGVYNNGEKCLGENIADVGGLNVAFDCYTRHLEAMHYSESSIEELQRLFLKGWAYSWRTKSTQKTMQYLHEKDVHSSYYARVIGPMQNFDPWYELFDVQPNQKYYLAPSKRCQIW